MKAVSYEAREAALNAWIQEGLFDMAILTRDNDGGLRYGRAKMDDFRKVTSP